MEYWSSEITHVVPRRVSFTAGQKWPRGRLINNNLSTRARAFVPATALLRFINFARGTSLERGDAGEIMDPADPGHPADGVGVVPSGMRDRGCFFPIRPEIRPAGKNLSAVAYGVPSRCRTKKGDGSRADSGHALACF